MLSALAIAVAGRLKGPVIDFFTKRALKAHWTGVLGTIATSTQVDTLWNVLLGGIVEGAEPSVHDLGVAIGATVASYLVSYFLQWQGWANKPAPVSPKNKD